MLTFRSSSVDGVLRARSTPFRRLKRTLLHGAICMAVFGAAGPQLFAAETEPLYYIYRGQHRALALDSSHVAVHLRTTASDRIPVGLMSRGYTVADVESRP